MKVKHHIGFSIAVSLALLAISRSISLSVTAFIAGVGIDIDHVFDYLREKGFRLDIDFFFHTFNNTLYKRVVLALHSWELLAAIACLMVTSRFNPIATGIFIGMGLHLIADQLYNKPVSAGYFFIYRLRWKFITGKIFPGKGLG